MTSPFNPYDPPTADELDRGRGAGNSSTQLASLGQRWLAATIDGLLVLLVVVPLQYKFGVFAKYSAHTELSLSEHVLWAALTFVIWFAEHGYFLATRSQSIGKRALGIRIEDMAGGRTALWKIVLLRDLPFSFIGNIPVIGVGLALADLLLIFRNDRRCVHDHLAGTQVVRVREEPLR